MLSVSRCPGCGSAEAAPCPACVAALVPVPAQAPPGGLDLCRSLFLYQGVGRRLVTELKYRNDRATLSWLADELAALVGRPAWPVVVTWPPTSAGRRRRRGFDQAEILARAVARRWRQPCARLLVRRGGGAQTGGSAAERRLGPDLIATRAVRGAVVVVDDVLTTGATLSSAARVLRRAGADQVAALTVARVGVAAPASREAK